MNFIKKIIKHKIILAAVVLLAAAGIYFILQNNTGTKTAVRYITSTVKKETIVVSVSGSGQVSSLNQIDLKPKASGDVISVNAIKGQNVNAGTLIASLNAKEALKSLRDAQANLESAKISLEKLQQPADTLTLLQSENALIAAQKSKAFAEDDLKKSYDDAFTAISNAFLDLPAIMSGLESVLVGSGVQDNASYYYDLVKSFDDSALTFKSSAVETYNTARLAYDKNFLDYKATSRYAETDAIESLLHESYETTKTIAEALKNTDNFLSFTYDRLSTNRQFIPAQLSAQRSSISGYIDQTNSHLQSLLNNVNTITNTKEEIESSERSIEEKIESLKQLKAGTDALDLKSGQLSVAQKQNALLDAQQTLANYSIRAPFDGIIAELDVKKYDTVSAGTAIGTLITAQKIAEISLNEVDAPKVKAGQDTILTFDAVTDLSITGKVVDVDSLGTVSSGVVSYGVKIAFDVQDQRIKSGMSLSVNIIIESKPDVLVVPISAVKIAGDESYVQILVNGIPEKKTVTTGISSETLVEIIDGLAPGDEVVTQTLTGASAGASTGSNTNTSGNNNAMRGIMQLQGGGAPPR